MAAEADSKPAKRKYSAEEKKQLLANLDLEVSHRAQQFESWLADALENFRVHQESHISRVPPLVRNITMREFAKYNGDIRACLRALNRERLGGEAEAIDKTTRKRKWVESQEAELKVGSTTGDLDAESSKGVKNARIMTATPKKAGPSNGVGTAQRVRLPVVKTPATARMMQRIPSRAPSPSPYKPGPSRHPIPFPRLNSRPPSPSKLPSPSKPSSSTTHTLNVRLPSAPSFNPAISSASHPRWPRRDESMLSANGSPLANPLSLDLSGWLSKVTEVDGEEGGGSEHSVSKANRNRMHTRTNSIIVRSTSSNGLHSRTNSQTTIVVASQSQSNPRTNGFIPTRTPRATPPQEDTTLTDLGHSFPSLTALVAVPTQDGHLLEFNPFETTPGEIDALEGISDGAKRQAKEDMARLVMQAVERWKI